MIPHTSAPPPPPPPPEPPPKVADNTGGPNGGGVVTPPPAPTTEGIPTGTNGPWSTVVADGVSDPVTLKADTIYFEFDSATIKKSEDKKLEEVAKFLQANPADALRVEGNCDERGTEKYNLALGERRAQAAREYLVTLGIDSRQVVTLTFGAAKPADPGHNEAAWSKNRRGDMVLLTPKK